MTGIILSPVLAAAGPSMAIPGPYWLFTILHWLTFSLHLIAMNVLFGGLLILLIFRSNPAHGHLFPVMTKAFPTVMAATITLGVAPLLFLQVIYGKFFYSASIVSGWNWFLIIPVAIVVYYLLYLVAMKEKLSVSSKTKLLIVVLIGFIYISYTLTLISDLTEKPDLLPDLYRSFGGGFAFSPDYGEILFRWLHSIAGALAVAGVSIQLFSIHNKKLAGNSDLLRLGSRTFLHGVILATLLGLIYLFTWQVEIIKAFLKSPGFHAILGAIVLNIIALIINFRVVKSDRPHLKIWTSAVLVFAGVFCMVIARDALRLIYLEGHFDPAALVVKPQWLVFIVFFVLFIAGLVTLFWMIRKYFAAPRSAS